MNPEYKDNDFEQYADYMEYIREAIAEESGKKFTMNKFKPTPDDIEITNISKDNGIDNNEVRCKEGYIQWCFYYTIKAPSIHPTLYIPDPRIDKTQGMSRKVSFNEWKRIQLVNARIEKMNILGI